jgi:AI-2 transport protein TqsA
MSEHRDPSTDAPEPGALQAEPGEAPSARAPTPGSAEAEEPSTSQEPPEARSVQLDAGEEPASPPTAPARPEPEPAGYEQVFRKLGRSGRRDTAGKASRPVGSEQGVLITGSLLIIAAVAITVALMWAQAVMVPFVLALLVTYMVTPMVDLLQTRLKVPRFLALLVAFVVISGGISMLVLLLVTSIEGLTDNAAQYERTWSQMVGWAQETYVRITDRFGIDLGLEAQVNDLADQLGELPIIALGWAKNTAGGVLNFLSTTFLVLIFVIYLILGHTPSEQRQGLWGQVDRKVRRYIVTKVLTSATTGLLTGLILWALGVDLALVFGMMAFLLNFIPSIGSIIATLLPLPIAMMQFGMGWQLGLVLLLPGAVQMTIGNGLEPKIMGDSLDLHPITILLTLIFWGLVWGPVGMLLAAPITAVLRIVLDRFDTTRPVAELLAGRLPEL